MTRTILITGSSIGIGRFAAYEFAKNGDTAIITYRTHKKEAEETAEKCKQLGGKASTMQLDVMKDESIDKALESVKKKYKEIDVLVNNAGYADRGHLIDEEDKETEQMLRTNVEGLIKLTKRFLPITKEIIINVASDAGKIGIANLSTYCASKFAVRGFTFALAKEVEQKVYCVNPGITSTRMTNYLGEPPQNVAKKIFKAAQGKQPSGSEFDM